MLGAAVATVDGRALIEDLDLHTEGAELDDDYVVFMGLVLQTEVASTAARGPAQSHRRTPRPAPSGNTTPMRRSTGHMTTL